MNKEELITASNELFRGQPILIAGGTGSGKSTVIENFAASETVAKLMESREGNGVTTINTCRIYINNSNSIPENELIVKGTFIEITQDELDDGEFITDILYSACDSCKDGFDSVKYRSGAEKTFGNRMKNNKLNTTLPYKLRLMDDTQRNDLLDRIVSDDQHQRNVFQLFTDIKSELAQKEKGKIDSKKIKNCFNQKIRSNAALTELYKNIWEYLIGYFKAQIILFQSTLIDAGAVLLNELDGQKSFIVSLSEKDIENSSVSLLAGLLLNSESGSIEYLFEDMSLMFRGKPDIMEQCPIFIAKSGQPPVKGLCLIDTCGLTNDTDDIEEEVTRLEDLVAINSISEMILTVKCFTESTVKKANEIIIRYLGERLKHKIKIALLFTQADRGILFIKNAKDKCHDFEKQLERLRQENEEYLNDCISALQESDSEIAGFLIGVGYPDAEQGSVERFVFNQGLSFSQVPNDIIHFLAENDTSRPRVELKGKTLREFAEEIVTVNEASLNGFHKYESDIHNNLTGCIKECSRAYIYWKTVDAVRRKWVENGRSHETNAVYYKLKTNFVDSMRDAASYAMEYFNVHFDGNIPRSDNGAAFDGELKKFLLSDGYSRNVAMAIGKAAYKSGYEKAIDEGDTFNDAFEIMFRVTLEDLFDTNGNYNLERWKEFWKEAYIGMIAKFINDRCIII